MLRFEGIDIDGYPGCAVLVDMEDGTELEVRFTGHQIEAMQREAERVADRLRRAQYEKWG